MIFSSVPECFLCIIDDEAAERKGAADGIIGVFRKGSTVIQ